jgi:hypothetical protein
MASGLVYRPKNQFLNKKKRNKKWDIKVYATGLLLLMGVKWGDEFIHSFAFLFSHFGTLNR